MKIEPEELPQYYATISDDALMDIDTADLVEIAKRCYDEEMSRKRASEGQPWFRGANHRRIGG